MYYYKIISRKHTPVIPFDKELVPSSYRRMRHIKRYEPNIGGTESIMQFKGMELCDFCFGEVKVGAACNTCGFTHENYKYLYNKILAPGTILMGKYIIGRVLRKDESKTAYLALTSDREKVVITEYLPSAMVQRENSEEIVTVPSEKKEDFLKGARQFVANAEEMASAGRGVSEIFYNNATVYYCTRYDNISRGGTELEKTLDLNSKAAKYGTKNPNIAETSAPRRPASASNASADRTFPSYELHKSDIATPPHPKAEVFVPHINPASQETKMQSAPSAETPEASQKPISSAPITEKQIIKDLGAFPKPEMPASSKNIVSEPAIPASSPEKAPQEDDLTEKTAIWVPEASHSASAKKSNAEARFEAMPAPTEPAPSKSAVKMPKIRKAENGGAVSGNIKFIEVYADAMTDLGPEGVCARLIYDHSAKEMIYSIERTDGSVDEDRIQISANIDDVRSLIKYALSQRPEWDICFEDYIKAQDIVMSESEKAEEIKSPLNNGIFDNEEPAEMLKSIYPQPWERDNDGAISPASPRSEKASEVGRKETEIVTAPTAPKPEMPQHRDIGDLPEFPRPQDISNAAMYPTPDVQNDRNISFMSPETEDMFYAEKGKKKKWLLPVILIIVGILCATVSAILVITLFSGEDEANGGNAPQTPVQQNGQMYDEPSAASEDIPVSGK